MKATAVPTPGIFITLEGLDGCGKSTQLELLAGYLRGQGRAVTTTLEPGGTWVGRQIRELLLHSAPEPLTPLTELALMFAARAQHIDGVILPALRRGEIVLCDRFTDSSYAYQGYGRGVPLDAIRQLERVLCQGLRPDLTLLLDMDATLSRERTGARNRKASEPHSRFEQEGLGFFERVRRGYLEIAVQEPLRVRRLDAGGSIQQLHEEICQLVDRFLHDRLPAGGKRLGGGGGGV